MKILNKIDQLPWHESKRWNTRHLSECKKIIIHQEAGEGSVSAVNNYHINPNHVCKTGCPHFCYHLGIEKDGTIIQANELTDITYHTKGQNDSGIGIMFVGDFKGYKHKGKSEPTPEQIEALKWVVMWLQGITYIPNTEVYGHYHFGKLSCPGNTIQKWIREYRK